MRRLMPHLSSAVLLIWIVGSVFWYKKNYETNPKLQHQARAVTASFEPFKLSGAGSGLVNFKFCDTKPIYQHASIAYFKNQVDFLNMHTHKALLIRGFYDAKEKECTPSVDLGSARAEAIKETLICLGAEASSVLTTSLQNSDLHFENNMLSNGAEFIIKDKTLKNVPQINLLYAHKQISFVNTSELEAYFSAVKQMLQNNNKVIVNIKGYAEKAEKLTYVKNRLSYLRGFFEEQNFPMNRMSFKIEKTNFSYSKQKKVEIRFATT